MNRRSFWKWIPAFLAAAALLFAQVDLGYRCPVCIKAKQESKVYPGMGFSTAAYCQPFYDEKGRYHSHECNSSTYEYSCSRDHRWRVIAGRAACPHGDFEGSEPVTIILDDGGKKK